MPLISSTPCGASITATQGAAGALLLDDRVYAELIADGFHIHSI